MTSGRNVPDPVIVLLQPMQGQPETTRVVQPSNPIELRKLRVEEFLQARSLAPKSQKAY